MSGIDVFKKIVNFLIGKKTVSKGSLVRIGRDWEEIEVLLKGSSPSQLKQALITADRSLDSVLKDLASGETMGDRLKNGKNLFYPQTYDRVWQAHKLRNALVHESGFEVQGFILKNAVDQLKNAVKELGVKV
jgi:hypothetical protein